MHPGSTFRVPLESAKWDLVDGQDQAICLSGSQFIVWYFPIWNPVWDLDKKHWSKAANHEQQCLSNSYKRTTQKQLSKLHFNTALVELSLCRRICRASASSLCQGFNHVLLSIKCRENGNMTVQSICPVLCLPAKTLSRVLLIQLGNWPSAQPCHAIFVHQTMLEAAQRNNFFSACTSALCASRHVIYCPPLKWFHPGSVLNRMSMLVMLKLMTTLCMSYTGESFCLKLCGLASLLPSVSMSNGTMSSFALSLG